MKTGKKLLIGFMVVFALLVCFTFGASAEAKTYYCDGFTYTLEEDLATIIEIDEALGENVVIPSSLDGHTVVVIDRNAGNNVMVNVFIPETVYYIYSPGNDLSVPRIQGGAFYNCENLCNINVDTRNSVYASIDGVLYSKDGAILYQYPQNKEDSEYIVPDGVDSIYNGAFNEANNLTYIDLPDSTIFIGWYAFSYCENLLNIDLGKNIEYIYDCAFIGCRSLEKIYIPESIWHIGFYVFRSCRNLSSIYVEENNSHYATVDGVLFDKEKTILMQYASGKKNEEYNIPIGVVSIEGCAFSNADNLINITIPHSVKTMAENAFVECANLERVTIGCGVEKLSSFNSCYNLKDVYYRDTLEKWQTIDIFEYADIFNATIHFHEHSFSEWIMETEASCTENGEMVRYCTGCGAKETQSIEAIGHIDSDKNGICDTCGFDKTQTCSCNCHKTGFSAFIYKILFFFYKLFKTNTYCSCGMAHY